MLRLRRPIPGEPPGTLRAQDEVVRRKPVIKLTEYDRAHLEERVIEDRDELVSHLNNQHVTWINIDGLGDIEVLRTLGSQFNLHPLALEDVLDTAQRPKVEQYDNYLFIVAHMIYRDRNHDMCGEQVSMFLGKHFLITLQEEAEFDAFEPVRGRIRNANGTIRKMGPDYLAYALLDSIVDHYYPVLEDVGAKIDLVESYRDVLSGLMELYLSAVGIRTNEIMRVLTVISSIFIPLTFIAGVYGMNFAHEVDGKKLPWNMPELFQPWGYIACLLFMLAIAIFQLIYFKKKRWL